MLEMLQVPFRPLGLSWQVPAHWLLGRSSLARTLVWGTILGPGLATRNPYAGMWLLPLLITLSPTVFVAMVTGMAVGAAHGGARAVGVLSNERHRDITCSPVVVLGAQRHWQFMDALALSLAAGALGAYVLALLGVAVR